MTPAAWLAATSPDPLLTAVRDQPSDPRTGRRLRLAASAFARQVWDFLSTDARSAVLASERFADGRATRTDLAAVAIPVPVNPRTAEQFAARAAAWASTGSPVVSTWHRPPPNEYQGYADPPMTEPSPTDAALNAAKALALAVAGIAPHALTSPRWRAAWYAAFDAARRVQADLVRDIFPPPGYAPHLDPAWLTATAVALAREMDESGDFSAVPILADALQDAGCDDELLLGHCREPGRPHVRGNWVVDAVLGRS